MFALSVMFAMLLAIVVEVARSRRLDHLPTLEPWTEPEELVEVLTAPVHAFYVPVLGKDGKTHYCWMRVARWGSLKTLLIRIHKDRFGQSHREVMVVKTADLRWLESAALGRKV